LEEPLTELRNSSHEKGLSRARDLITIACSIFQDCTPQALQYITVKNSGTHTTI
jgi:hypothetical protein